MFLMLNQEEYIKRTTENYHNYTFFKISLWFFRQNGSDVIGDIVMKFKFARNSNEPSVKRKIESVLRQMLNKPGNLAMNTIDLTRKYHFFSHFISIYLSTSSNSCFDLMRD